MFPWPSSKSRTSSPRPPSRQSWISSDFLGLEKVEYEPEQFPGLVYRIDEPKVVVLLFGSGKLVCTGARKPSDVEQAVEKITAELKAAGLPR